MHSIRRAQTVPEKALGLLTKRGAGGPPNPAFIACPFPPPEQLRKKAPVGAQRGTG